MLLALMRNFGPRFSKLIYSTVTNIRYRTVCTQNRLLRIDSGMQTLIYFKYQRDAIASWVPVTSYVIQIASKSHRTNYHINKSYKKLKHLNIYNHGKDSVDLKSKM